MLFLKLKLLFLYSTFSIFLGCSTPKHSNKQHIQKKKYISNLSLSDFENFKHNTNLTQILNKVGHPNKVTGTNMLILFYKIKNRTTVQIGLQNKLINYINLIHRNGEHEVYY